MSEILPEGNNNLNLDPVVAHKTVELVESYRSPVKKQTLYYNAVTLKIYTVNRFNVFLALFIPYFLQRK